MSFSGWATTFAGLPVVNVEPDTELRSVDGPVAWRVCLWEYDGGTEFGSNAAFHDALEDFLDEVDAASVTALVVGTWGYAAFDDAPIAQLCAAADRLTSLKALFLGDITADECEVSWIRQGDLTPLLAAYPNLRILRVRGTGGLSLGRVRHTGLRELALEGGGLPAEMLRAVIDADLPGLERLELWLGTPRYGGDVGVADLGPLLDGARFPALRALGLRNAEIADRVAGAVDGAPLVARLEELDLSLGVMGDEGGEALLSGRPLTHLRRLDLRRNYLSERMAARLVAELPGVEVDVSDQQVEGEYGRYTAVSE
ncbi:STM4015 family protein [Rugosimonospora acidiphila]|uniref:STM4015 family protein n=1 Tax=Rugosimonospora acidiphila TaxID=556531 RepID=A0ABP9SCJ8_9ACTN